MKYLFSLILLVSVAFNVVATPLPYDIHRDFKVKDGNMTRAFENLMVLTGRKLELEEVSYGLSMGGNPQISVRIRINYDPIYNDYMETGCMDGCVSIPEEEYYTTLEGSGETIEEALWDFYMKVCLSNLSTRNF
jgi:hypothetical protein